MSGQNDEWNEMKSFFGGDFLYIFFVAMNPIPRTILDVAISTESLKSWKNGTFADAKQSKQSTSWSIHLLVLANQQIEGNTEEICEQLWKPQASFFLCLYAAMVFFMCINRSDLIYQPLSWAQADMLDPLEEPVKQLVLLQPADVGLRYICFQLIAVIQGKTLLSLNSRWSNTAPPILKNQHSGKEHHSTWP